MKVEKHRGFSERDDPLAYGQRPPLIKHHHVAAREAVPGSAAPEHNAAMRNPFRREAGTDATVGAKKPEYPKETDPARLAQRQKQIDIGKNTLGYDRYITQIPKHTRGPKDPKTPDITRVISKRGWDGLVKQWRRALHVWDPPIAAGDEVVDPVAEAAKLRAAVAAATAAAAGTPSTHNSGLTEEERELEAELLKGTELGLDNNDAIFADFAADEDL